MGLLKGVEGWEDGYATENEELARYEWNAPSEELGVRHFVWCMVGLAQLVSTAIHLAVPLLFVAAGMALSAEAALAAQCCFFAARLLCPVPAAKLAAVVGPRRMLVGAQLLSAAALAGLAAAPPARGLLLLCALSLGAAQAALAPTFILLWESWARVPAERDQALLCSTVGSAVGALAGWLHTSCYGGEPYYGRNAAALAGGNVLAAAAGLAGVLWWIFGSSTPVEWGGSPGSALIPLTVSDLEALPPPNINEKAIAAKKEREVRFADFGHSF